MARKRLTIEYDTDQDFFGSEDNPLDESLRGYLVNEFNNHDLVATLYEEDVDLPPTEQRLEALQDAIARFEANFKHALLAPLTYPEPPHWLAPLVRDLHAALVASKVQG